MIKISKATMLVVALLATAGAAQLRAEAINPATMPQTVPMTAQEKKNLDFVLNWFREVLYAGHLELAPKYQAEDYIQHNPNVNTGRQGFVDYFSKLAKPMNPIPATLKEPPVVKGAKGDYVWLIFEHERQDPHDPSKTYHIDSFDVIRLQNGKVQEHWDSAQKMAGTGDIKFGVSPKPPMQWNTGKLSKEEEKSIALATEEMKDILQYWHLELADKTMDPGYIQHNPLVPQGREGFKTFMGRAGRTPQPIKTEWLNAPVLTLANGPYVLMMWYRKAMDPDNPNREYTLNHFDAIRIENGLIKEHWDEGTGRPPGQ